MRHSLAGSLLAFAALTRHATATDVDYASGEPISSSSDYYPYHTKWMTTTCYETMTKTGYCSYDGGVVGDYKTVSPQVYPGLGDDGTVYETVYETAHPYPYEAGKTVCHPETVYSTVYPDASEGGTVTASPVYHTMDSTIMETVTATPSGLGGCRSNPPWLYSPGFDDLDLNVVWFMSGQVAIVPAIGPLGPVTSPDGSPYYARLDFTARDEARIEQAITIPNGRSYTLTFFAAQYRGNPGDILEFQVSLGSYASNINTRSISYGAWGPITIEIGEVNVTGGSACLPVVFGFQVRFAEGEGDQQRGILLDRLELTSF